MSGPADASVALRHFGSSTEGVTRIPAGDGLPAHVLKVLSPDAGNVHGMGPGTGRDEGDCHYWAREQRFYEAVASGEWPPAVGLPLRPPRPLAVERRPDGRVALRLERIDESEGEWTADDYREAAAHLGEFNGHHLVRPLP
ncbi:hypothetical protein, partial [Streptomyces sp. MBT53]|uniref:hypothetical protein n=1 Tax=Streptomyces sp. MBT53 TaxID=1488384 RepID=UPI00191240A3